VTTATEHPDITAQPVRKADLALAALRTRLLGERLPETEQPALVERWSELLEELEEHPRAADSILATYRAEVEDRLAATR
jgi:hypothetical protein